MPEPLSTDEFFTRLTALLASATTAQKHSVTLTQKPYPKEHADPAAPPSLLIRVTNGATSNDKGGPAPHLVKISTVVAGKDIDNFFVRYADVWKGGMGALKKRDRRKKKKVKKTTATPAVTVAA